MNLEERELAGTQAESLDAESQPPPAEAEAAEQPSSQPLFQTIEVPSQESGLAAEQPTPPTPETSTPPPQQQPHAAQVPAGQPTTETLARPPQQKQHDAAQVPAGQPMLPTPKTLTHWG